MNENIDSGTGKWNRWGIYILCGIALIAVIPVIVAARYTFFQADDFSHANTVGVFGGNILELFVASLKYTKKMYFEWQGTYLSMFLQAFLSPLNSFGAIQLCVVMLLNILIFIISLFTLIRAFGKYIELEFHYVLAVFAICIIGIFGFASWEEVFYWFSGAVSYSFPLSFCFLGISAALQSKRAGSCIMGLVLVFMASGGTLEVAGAGCFILLGICIVKKIANIAEYRDYIFLASAVIGALINSAAPGNYVRQSMIDSTGIHVHLALSGAICETVNTTEVLLCDTPFLLFLLLAFFIGIKAGQKRVRRNEKCLALVFLLSIVEPVVTCFPVILGYSGSSFPNRCKFVETVIIVMALVLIAVIAGDLLGGRIKDLYFIKQMCAILVVVLTVMPSINEGWRLTESVSYKMWEQMADDSYKDYNLQVRDIYNTIADDSNPDVFIYELPVDIPGFSRINISEDMSDWVNAAIASYYGRKSVQYVSGIVYEKRNGEKNIRISPSMFDTTLDNVSVFKVSDTDQKVDALLMLEPLVQNMIISVQDNESGKVGVYIFEDAEGKKQIEQMEIEY